MINDKKMPSVTSEGIFLTSTLGHPKTAECTQNTLFEL